MTDIYAGFTPEPTAESDPYAGFIPVATSSPVEVPLGNTVPESPIRSEQTSDPYAGFTAVSTGEPDPYAGFTPVVSNPESTSLLSQGMDKGGDLLARGPVSFAYTAARGLGETVGMIPQGYGAIFEATKALYNGKDPLITANEEAPDYNWGSSIFNAFEKATGLEDLPKQEGGQLVHKVAEVLTVGIEDTAELIMQHGSLTAPVASGLKLGAYLGSDKAKKALDSTPINRDTHPRMFAAVNSVLQTLVVVSPVLGKTGVFKSPKASLKVIQDNVKVLETAVSKSKGKELTPREEVDFIESTTKKINKNNVRYEENINKIMEDVPPEKLAELKQPMPEVEVVSKGLPEPIELSIEKVSELNPEINKLSTEMQDYLKTGKPLPEKLVQNYDKAVKKLEELKKVEGKSKPAEPILKEMVEPETSLGVRIRNAINKDQPEQVIEIGRKALKKGVAINDVAHEVRNAIPVKVGDLYRQRKAKEISPEKFAFERRRLNDLIDEYTSLEKEVAASAVRGSEMVKNLPKEHKYLLSGGETVLKPKKVSTKPVKRRFTALEKSFRKNVLELTRRTFSLTRSKQRLKTLMGEFLPETKQGIVDIDSIKGWSDLTKAHKKIRTAVERGARQTRLDKLSDRLEKVRTLPLAYQEAIAEVLGGISLKEANPRTIKSLQGIEKALANNPLLWGKLSSQNIKKVSDIKRIYGTPAKKLRPQNLDELISKAEQLETAGRKVIKEQLRKDEIAVGLDKTQVLKVAIPLETIELGRGLKELGIVGKVKQTFAKSSNVLKGVETSLKSPSLVAEMMQGWKTDGPIKKGIVDMSEAVHSGELADFAFKQTRVNIAQELAKKHGKFLTEKERIQVYLYSLRQQKGGVKYIERSGLEKEAKAQGFPTDKIKMTDHMMEYYQQNRVLIDSLYPALAESSYRYKGIDLGWVENYTPRNVFGDVAIDTFDIINNEHGGAMNAPKANMLKQRMGANRDIYGGKKDLSDFDFEKVLDRYYSDATHFIAVAPVTTRWAKILNDSKVKKALGSMSHKYLQGYVERTARKGYLSEYKRNAFGQYILRNLGMAQLGYRLSPMIKQPLAFFPAMGLIGADAVRFMPELLINRKLRDAVEKNSPVIKMRSLTADSPEFQTKGSKGGKQGLRARVAEQAFGGLKFFDKQTAKTVWYGAYRQSMGSSFKMPEFMAGKVSQRASRFADDVVRKTQGTGSAIDLPAMYAGRNAFTARAVLAFQSYLLNDAMTLIHVGIQKGFINPIKKGAKGEGNSFQTLYDIVGELGKTDSRKGTQMVMFYLLGKMAEDIAQDNISVLFSSEEYSKKRMERSWVTSGKEALVSGMPLLNNLLSMGNYGGTGIPAMDMVKDFVKATPHLFSDNEKKKVKAWIDVSASVGSTVVPAPGIGQAKQLFKQYMYNPGGDLIDPDKMVDEIENRFARLGELWESYAGKKLVAED